MNFLELWITWKCPHNVEVSHYSILAPLGYFSDTINDYVWYVKKEKSNSIQLRNRIRTETYILLTILWRESGCSWVFQSLVSIGASVPWVGLQVLVSIKIKLTEWQKYKFQTNQIMKKTGADMYERDKKIINKIIGLSWTQTGHWWNNIWDPKIVLIQIQIAEYGNLSMRRRS